MPNKNVIWCIPVYESGFIRKQSSIEQTHRLVQFVRKDKEANYESILHSWLSKLFDKAWKPKFTYYREINENLFN